MLENFIDCQSSPPPQKKLIKYTCRKGVFQMTTHERNKVMSVIISLSLIIFLHTRVCVVFLCFWNMRWENLFWVHEEELNFPGKYFSFLDKNISSWFLHRLCENKTDTQILYKNKKRIHYIDIVLMDVGHPTHPSSAFSTSHFHQLSDTFEDNAFKIYAYCKSPRGGGLH